MSARPGRITCDQPVPLEHPRHYAVKTTPAFMDLKARLTKEIRVEAQRAAALAARGGASFSARRSGFIHGPRPTLRP
ncbi:MAG: transporter ATP-binding protein [Ramlibacter sp.]|jgi:hypothetical protein|nr:transporter ATP-binding protein [Ramlibacter sp.]